MFRLEFNKCVVAETVSLLKFSYLYIIVLIFQAEHQELYCLVVLDTADMNFDIAIFCILVFVLFVLKSAS